MQSRECVEEVRVRGGGGAVRCGSVRKDGTYALTTSEEVMEDDNDGAGEVTIYEAVFRVQLL